MPELLNEKKKASEVLKSADRHLRITLIIRILWRVPLVMKQEVVNREKLFHYPSDWVFLLVLLRLGTPVSL